MTWVTRLDRLYLLQKSNLPLDNKRTGEVQFPSRSPVSYSLEYWVGPVYENVEYRSDSCGGTICKSLGVDVIGSR